MPYGNFPANLVGQTPGMPKHCNLQIVDRITGEIRVVTVAKNLITLGWGTVEENL